MASSLVSGTIALLLILIAGYTIASGILTISETTMNAQTQMAGVYENIKETMISIPYAVTGGTTTLTFGVANNGSTTFGGTDLKKMDVFLYDSRGLTRYSLTDCTYTLVNDLFNKGMWDPTEIMNVTISGTTDPKVVKFVTPNGVIAYNLTN